MRRLARHLLTLGSAASMLLCVAACVLWVRSYLVWDTFEQYRLDPGGPLAFAERYGLFTGPGVIGYGKVRLDDPGKQRWPRANTSWRWEHRPRPGPEALPHERDWSWLGFASWDIRIPRGNGGGGVRGFQIPLWSLVLLFGALSTRWLTRARRWRHAHRRRRSGSCTSCGYDLRATPDRCPECGTLGGKANA